MTRETKDTQDTANLPRLIGPREVCKALGISQTTLWHWQRKGRFPRGVKLTRTKLVWRADHVQAWIDDQFSAPSAEEN
ncbi:MAG: helix-turn-helix transcriptional regulator [Hyphomicrobiaceae bacterium]